MPEVTHETKPLQTRRGNLIRPPVDPRDAADSRKKKKKVELAPVKPSGFLAKLFLCIIIVACFAALFQSDVLWTEYDSAERSSFQSMDSWTEAWEVAAIRSEDPIATSSYFWEQSIPLPTPITHRGINLLLHIIATLLFLKCLEALKAPAAFAATLVFSTHPAVLQTIFWTGYRTEILGLILVLIALLAGIRNRGASGYAVALIFTAFACVIHPAAIAIPVILAGIVILQNKKLKFPTFNRVLPLICIALFIGVWTQDNSVQATLPDPTETNQVLNHAGENMFFYIKQALMPLTVGLFHPAAGSSGYKVGGSMSLLPFLLFIPFLILIALNFRKTWARAALLGLVAFLLLSLNGISENGAFLDNERAYENHGLYIALPAIVALLICGLGQLARHMGTAGKLLWVMGFSLFIIIQFSITATYAYSVGQPTTMWQTMSEQWTESWIPKAALIESIMATDSELLTDDEQIEMLTAVLNAQPELTEERISLARIYKDAGQNTNAVREYKRILRDSKPTDDFLEEAARFYDKVGLSWDARNARERKRTSQ